jgi:hypothetical protein
MCCCMKNLETAKITLPVVQGDNTALKDVGQGLCCSCVSLRYHGFSCRSFMELRMFN